MDRPRALVIGGSLGGLFAAHLLRSIGWDVAVFERSKADLADRGLGLGTRPELFEVMRRIDIDLDPSIGVEVRSRIGLDRNGEVMCEVPVRGVATAWDRIYRALKTALPSEFYRSGMQLERFEQETRTVTAIFADGLRVEGDLLVGADGIHSTVRRQLLPEVNPRYAGYVNWRGVVEEGDWTTAINSMVFQHMTFCFPDGEMALSIPMAASCGHAHQARRRCAFGWMRPVDYGVPLRHMCTDADGHHHGETIPPPLIRPELIKELKDSAVASLAPQIAALVARGEQPILQPIYDLESPCLAFGRAVLVGDAAFVARPHVGTGVTKAALDAQCLADALLGAKNDIEAALTHYDRERRRSGMAVVARGRYLGRLLEIGSKPRKPRTAGESRRHAETVIREFGSGGAIGGDPNNAREGDSAEQDA